MVGCLYISEFSAWALQAQRRDLHALAVYHNGRIVARSRFLVQAGMLLGDPLDRARALFPDASFFARDASFDQAVWDGVLRRIHEVTPYLQPLVCGTAFFRPYALPEARLLAEDLGVRVGLGPNTHVARIAAVRSASGSVLQIGFDAVTRFLAQTKVSVLPHLGFDEEIPARLDLFGLGTLDKVRLLTHQHLRVQFGDVGSALHDLLHPPFGARRVSLYVPPPTIGEHFSFDFATDDFTLVSSLLDRMIQRAALRLGRFRCSRLYLRLDPFECSEASRRAQRTLRSPSSDPLVIGRAATYLLQRLLANPIELSSLSVSLTGLENPTHTQASLFFDRPPLSKTIERIEERFPGAALRAVVVHPEAPFPEDRVRFVPFSE